MLIGSEYYLGFFKNHDGGNPSIIIATTELQPVFYFIEIPGIGYHYNGTVTANNEDIVDLPSSVEVLSHYDQNKGIYLKTSSDRATVIGKNVKKGTSDFFFGLPSASLCVPQYIYYGMSVPKLRLSRNFYSSVLIVGTEDNTVMNLTVTQPVTIRVDNTNTNLIPGRQYSFVIKRLQTVYIGSLEDLTGTKTVTNKPVSVFSGHQLDNNGEDYLIEQIPPVSEWGKVFYVSPMSTRRSYAVKVIAAYDSTNVTFYCNSSIFSHIVNEANFIDKNFTLQEYCAIYSNKEVLVAQFTHDQSDGYGRGDPMMTLVPATIHYSNKFRFSTIQRSGYNHFVNIIVLAQYYQPDKIYLISGGVNKSLDTQKWVPVKVNNVIEAYATIATVSDGFGEILYASTSALLTTIVYGFADGEGYGHPGGLSYSSG